MKKIKHSQGTNTANQQAKKGGWILMILLLLFLTELKAQDNILLKNGIELKANVVEVTGQYIKYQKSNDKYDVVLSMPKADVFMITYENGLKETFDQKSSEVRRETGSEYSHVPESESANSPEINSFDPDSSDFAKLRKKKFNGPRIGFTYISPGTSADYMEMKGKDPYITQFGWQFESRLFTVDETSGVVEFVPLVGGFEQGMFIPSISVLLGLRTGPYFPLEFAIGPNISIVPDYYGDKKLFASIVIAVGTSIRKGNIYFPITFAVVPSVGNVAEVYDASTESYEPVKYYSGARFSLIVGFNSRKK